jgi:hypothetical protein
MNIYVFVWLLTLNRSDAGLIEKPKLVTCKFVNFVVHDGVLEYIYMYIYIYLTEARRAVSPKDYYGA